jgi:hypothetical protein
VHRLDAIRGAEQRAARGGRSAAETRHPGWSHGTDPDHRVRRRDVRNRTVQGNAPNDLATPLGTIVASDHPLDLFFTDYFRVASGKIVECEAVWDRLSIVAQLGASIGPMEATSQPS